MEISNLMLAMESADTNNLGLSRVFARLKNEALSGTVLSAQTVIQAVGSLVREGLDVAGLWKSLVQPPSSGVGEGGSLESRWTQVNEIVSKIFPDFHSTSSPEIRQVMTFMAWMNRLNDDELDSCANLLNTGNSANLSLLFRTVKDKLILQSPASSPAASTTATTRKTDGVKEHHCFVIAVRGDERYAYAGMWPDLKELKFAGVAPTGWKKWAVDSEAVEKAVEIFVDKFPDMRLVVHMLPAAREALQEKLAEYEALPDGEKNRARKLKFPI
jgi:hypothetical protein